MLPGAAKPIKEKALAGPNRLARLQEVSGQTEETGEAGARGGKVVGGAGEGGELALGWAGGTSASRGWDSRVSDNRDAGGWHDWGS